MEKRLNVLGFETMGDIACSDPSYLSRKFGIKGEELYLHANGIDKAVISSQIKTKPKSLSVGQVLFFDADINEAIGVAKEMGRVLSRRLRDNHNRLDLFFGGSKDKSQSYGRSLRFERPLETSNEIEQAIELLTSSCADKAHA